MLGRLLKGLKSRAASNARSPNEIRDLIDRGELTAARSALSKLKKGIQDEEAVRACLQGEILFRENLDHQAEAAFKEALKLVPGMAAAHHGLSILLAERRDWDTALRHAQFSLSVSPDDPHFLAQFGYCNLSLGNFQPAEMSLKRATALNPQLHHAWNNLGIIYRLKGTLQAKDCFETALRLRPGFRPAADNLAQLLGDTSDTPTIADASAGPSDASNNPTRPVELAAALELEQDGDLDAAIAACEVLAERGDEVAELAVIEINRLCVRLGDHEAGVAALEAFCKRNPNASSAIGTLGQCYLQASQFVQAERLLKQALEAQPEHFKFLVSYVRALSGQDRYFDAVPAIETLLATDPDNNVVLNLQAANLHNICRYEEALVACQKMMRAGMPVAYLGSVLGYLGRFDDALAALNEALQAQPNSPELHLQRAQIRLLHLDFEHGWDDYVYRGLARAKTFRMPPLPPWRGEPLKGKRIVVLAEQGLGDQVMFASCLPDLLAQEPGKVIVEAIDRVAPTLARSFPSCTVLSTNQDASMSWLKDVGGADYFVMLGDLPGHFRRSLLAFPDHRGYLVADPQRVAFWRNQLRSEGPGPYIGISWRGGTEATRATIRSMSLSLLSPLMESTTADWVCLQYGNVQAQLEEAHAKGTKLAYWPEAISNLDEFAALISALDLVITVCNTTVHYAGALGKPVWVMAPQIPEWRYGLHNEVLPWYPSSRMFRQDQSADWKLPIEAVRRRLESWRPPTDSNE